MYKRKTTGAAPTASEMGKRSAEVRRQLAGGTDEGFSARMKAIRACSKKAPVKPKP